MSSSQGDWTFGFEFTVFRTKWGWDSNDPRLVLISSKERDAFLASEVARPEQQGRQATLEPEIGNQPKAEGAEETNTTEREERGRIDVQLSHCIHGTLDDIDNVPATLMVFQFSLGNPSFQIRHFGIEFAFRSGKTKEADEPSIVNYAPRKLSSASSNPQSLLRARLRHTTYEMHVETSSLLSPQPAISWGLHSSEDAIVPSNYVFAILLKRNDYGKFFLRFGLAVKLSIQSAVFGCDDRRVNRDYERCIDPNMEPRGKLENIDPKKLGLVKIESLVNTLVSGADLFNSVEASKPSYGSTNQRYHVPPEPAPTAPAVLEPARRTPDSERDVPEQATGAPDHGFYFEDPPVRSAITQRSWEYTLGSRIQRRHVSIGCVRSDLKWSGEESQVLYCIFAIHEIADFWPAIPITRGVYTIIGVFKKDSAVPKERAVSFNGRDGPKSVSNQLHQSIALLLGVRRFFSLKELCGFSLYKVKPFSSFGWNVPKT